MNRVLIGVLIIAAVALIAVLLAGDPEPAPTAARAVADAVPSAPEQPAPPVVDAALLPPPPPPPDHGPTPPAVIEAERAGLMNREASWIQRMRPRGWTETAAGWRSPMGAEVTFATREGRVTGARVAFSEASFSSALSELTVPLIGHQDGGGSMLPGGEQAESLEPDSRPRTGTVKAHSGEYDWTLWLRTTGESPYGPARFELGDVGPLDGSPGPGP